MGQLLRNAEAAPDSQERILGVCRLMLSFCTDILRPSTQFADKTTNILERHQVRRSQLGNDLCWPPTMHVLPLAPAVRTQSVQNVTGQGCAVAPEAACYMLALLRPGFEMGPRRSNDVAPTRECSLNSTLHCLNRQSMWCLLAGAQPLLTYLHVHEACSYEDNISFWQAQAAPASKNVAIVQMVLQPAVSLKSNRFSSGAYVKIKLPGTCNIELGHDSYKVTLPKLLIRNPTGSSAETELGGKLRKALFRKCTGADQRHLKPCC